MERWIVRGEVTCAGCRYIGSVGVFFVGEGPQAPFHEHCDCARAAVQTTGLSAAALAALQREARQNGRKAAHIEARAWRLMAREGRQR
jgi:hypothetical protein